MEQPSIQTLSAPKGEFYEPPSSSKPILSDGFELRPGFIAMVREQSFSGTDSENPYHHLREFEQLCSCLTIQGMTQDTLMWKLFPFSLKGNAKQWYTHTVKSVNGDWKELRDKFCLSFFSLSHITSLRKEILCFQQSEKESIGAAWDRFSLLTKSGPDLSIPDHVLLQHFCLGLSKESALYLDITAGGSFIHKTTSEGRAILDRILENSSFTMDIDEPLQEESTSSVETPLLTESDPFSCNPIDSANRASPEPETSKVEEIQPSEFLYPFEEDLCFEDFGNTSKYSWIKKPTAPPWPPDPLQNSNSKVALVERLKEERRAAKAMQITSPSDTLFCSVKGTSVQALNNPNIEANIMSEYLAYNLLDNIPLDPTYKLFKSPSGHVFECCGIARAVPINIDKIECFLDFHVFAILDFDLLLGCPFQKIYFETYSHGSLNKNHLGTSFTTTSCSQNPTVTPHPKQSSLEEAMFVSSFASPRHASSVDAKVPIQERDGLDKPFHISKTEPSSIPLEPLPSGPPSVVLDGDQEPTMIFVDKILEKENLWPMEFVEASTLEFGHDYIYEHESFLLDNSCSHKESLELVTRCAKSTYEIYKQPALLCKMFRRVVVDAFVYHKYFKSRICILPFGTNLAAKAQ